MYLILYSISTYSTFRHSSVVKVWSRTARGATRQDQDRRRPGQMPECNQSEAEWHARALVRHRQLLRPPLYWPGRCQFRSCDRPFHAPRRSRLVILYEYFVLRFCICLGIFVWSKQTRRRKYVCRNYVQSMYKVCRTHFHIQTPTTSD